MDNKSIVVKIILKIAPTFGSSVLFATLTVEEIIIPIINTTTTILTVFKTFKEKELDLYRFLYMGRFAVE
jgi:hypothetical protein